MIHASVGFRVAYRAIPQSLMEKLEALNGGRQSAITGHCRPCRNFLLGIPPDDRFTATNLNPSLARPGQLRTLAFSPKPSSKWPVRSETCLITYFRTSARPVVRNFLIQWLNSSCTGAAFNLGCLVGHEKSRQLIRCQSHLREKLHQLHQTLARCGGMAN